MSKKFIAKTLQQELRSYLKLEDGWDGYDGRKLERGVVETAVKVVDGLEKAGVDLNEIFPAPGADDSILMDWDVGEHKIEIYVSEHENLVSLFKYPNETDPVREKELGYDADAIVNCFINEFQPELEKLK